MCALMQIGMLGGGLILAFVTKNKRWLILTLIGAAWFIYDVMAIALELAKS